MGTTQIYTMVKAELMIYVNVKQTTKHRYTFTDRDRNLPGL